MSTQEFLPMQEAQDQQDRVAQQIQQDTGVFEIAILARVKWNLHSLNNEGTIGNVTEPRTVVLWDGTKTDGVSGEMMKHIHAYWTWLQEKSNGANAKLCSACSSFEPQRADKSRGLPTGRGNEVNAMRQAIERCLLCDLHGFLVTELPLPRPSTVEFGWVIGIPGSVNRDMHVHARHAIQFPLPQGQQREEGEAAEQMPYHRPTRSGVYALITLFQPWRIGLNEVNYTYALDPAEQARRYRLALTAYEWTLKRPDGAMTTTRFPHIQGIEGIVLISRQPVPVPMLSPLRDDYREKLESLAEKQGVEAKKFDDLDQLVQKLLELHNEDPLRMPFPERPPGEPVATGGGTRGRRRRRREEETLEVLGGGEQSDLEASREGAQEPEPDQE